MKDRWLREEEPELLWAWLAERASSGTRHKSMSDPVLDAWDGDSILMAQALCGRLGLAVGISSGANFLGAVTLVEELAEEVGPDAVVATILPDSNKKYLSTDLCHEEPLQSNYLTPRITLESFTAVR